VDVPRPSAPSDSEPKEEWTSAENGTERFSRLVAEGQLRVPIAATYPLASAAAALAHAQRGGKVLFAVG
jgi:NADPH:quinone reductase-like Zn-dependent oxidoreductase